MVGAKALCTIGSADDTVSNSVVNGARTEVLTFGKVVAGTESVNKNRDTANTCESTDSEEPRSTKLNTLPFAGKDTEGKTTIADTVRTFYPSTVGIIGLGKLASINLTTTSTSPNVLFDEAKSTSTDFK